MKFDDNSSNIHQRSFITYDNFPSNVPIMIITNNTELRLIESHFLNSNFKPRNSSIINLDKCKTNSSSKPKKFTPLQRVKNAGNHTSNCPEGQSRPSGVRLKGWEHRRVPHR